MKEFNQGTLNYLNNKYYTYALIDPRTDSIFYIGKGQNNRVFEHEKDTSGRDTDKLNMIKELHDAGLEAKKVILDYYDTEREAFAAEASMINLLRYTGKLTNIVAGQSYMHEALDVESFSTIYGAELMMDDQITDNVLVVKLNNLYDPSYTADRIYDLARGFWKTNIKRAKKAKYVLAIYKGLVVGVYEPKNWIQATGNHATDYALNAPRTEYDQYFDNEFMDDDGYKKHTTGRWFFTGTDVSFTSKYYHKQLSDTYCGKNIQTAIVYNYK